MIIKIESYLLHKIATINEKYDKLILITSFIVYATIIYGFIYFFSTGLDLDKKDNLLAYAFTFFTISLLLFYYLKKLYIYVAFIGRKNTRNLILKEKKKEQIISEWMYTKEEWASFTKPYLTKKRKNRKYLLIPIFIFSLAFIFFEIESAIVFTQIILILIFIALAFENAQRTIWNYSLKKDKISLIFSKRGLLISNLFVFPFKLDGRRTTKVVIKKSTIEFNFTTFIPGGLESDSYTDEFKIEFPVPCRYEEDLIKLKKINNI